MTPHAIAGTYDPVLVLVSFGIAMFASYTALTLANRVTAAAGRARVAWLVGGSLAMGSGIWSMHFVGMLAFSIPGMPIVYDVPLLVLSVLVAILASAIALYVVSRSEVRKPALTGAGLAMAAAICGMHYIGIAGMRMPARILWDYRLVAASIVIALGASYAALWLAYRLRHRGRSKLLFPAGVVMGIAISGMHYTAMEAMRFTSHGHAMTVRDEDLLVTGGLALAVSISTVLILAIALISSFAQRELESQAALADEHGRLFLAADRRATEEEALRLATEELSDAFDVQDVLERITRSAHEATASDCAFVERIDEKTDSVTIAAVAGEGHPPAGSRRPYEGSFAEQVAGRRQPVLAGAAGDHSIIAVLLGDEPRPIGVLVLRRGSSADPFRDDVLHRVQTFSNLARLAFRRIQLLEEGERRREELAAAERLAGLGRLAGTMAHEFNNVLMSIQAFNEATRRAGTFEQYVRNAPEIDRAIQRGKSVTETVLRLTRAARPSLEPMDLCAWFSSVQQDLLSLMPPEIEVMFECEPGLFVRADENHLEQVLVNLALNARDAMPSGGQFAVTAHRDAAGLVHLSAADTGHGIPADEQKRIFEPLYTTRKGGTGLGLAIVHEIVRAHGGTITVESEPARGTRFDMILRASSPPAACSDPAFEDLASFVRRVLLVEDDDSVAAGLTLLLELSGVVVKRVALGGEAVSAIAGFNPDVVLLDVGLPDLDGRDVFDLIQSHSPGLPVVFATGHADESGLADIVSRPHAAFLRKPFQSDALFAAIRTVVR